MKVFRAITTLTTIANVAALASFASPVMAFSVTQTNNSEALRSSLLGTTKGLSNFSVSVSGNSSAFGVFKDDPFGLNSGVVLSTGRVTDLPGKNRSDTNNPDLSTYFEPDTSSKLYYDLVQLDLSFYADSTADKIFFQYVFGSEEFREYGGSQYNDSFELLLNGVNLAKLSDGKDVTINNLVPDNSKPSLDHPDYIDNPVNGSNLAAQIVKLDGYTKVLGFEGLLKKSQTNTLSIRMRDTADPVYDSAVFLKGGSISTEPPAVPEPLTIAGLLLGGSLLAGGRKLREKRSTL